MQYDIESEYRSCLEKEGEYYFELPLCARAIARVVGITNALLTANALAEDNSDELILDIGGSLRAEGITVFTQHEHDVVVDVEPYQNGCFVVQMPAHTFCSRALRISTPTCEAIAIFTAGLHANSNGRWSYRTNSNLCEIGAYQITWRDDASYGKPKEHRKWYRIQHSKLSDNMLVAAMKELGAPNVLPADLDGTLKLASLLEQSAANKNYCFLLCAAALANIGGYSNNSLTMQGLEQLALREKLHAIGEQQTQRDISEAFNAVGIKWCDIVLPGNSVVTVHLNGFDYFIARSAKFSNAMVVQNATSGKTHHAQFIAGATFEGGKTANGAYAGHYQILSTISPKTVVALYYVIRNSAAKRERSETSANEELLIDETQEMSQRASSFERDAEQEDEELSVASTYERDYSNASCESDESDEPFSYIEASALTLMHQWGLIEREMARRNLSYLLCAAVLASVVSRNVPRINVKNLYSFKKQRFGALNSITDPTVHDVLRLMNVNTHRLLSIGTPLHTTHIGAIIIDVVDGYLPYELVAHVNGNPYKMRFVIGAKQLSTTEGMAYGASNGHYVVTRLNDQATLAVYEPIVQLKLELDELPIAQVYSRNVRLNVPDTETNRGYIIMRNQAGTSQIELIVHTIIDVLDEQRFMNELPPHPEIKQDVMLFSVLTIWRQYEAANKTRRNHLDLDKSIEKAQVLSHIQAIKNRWNSVFDIEEEQIYRTSSKKNEAWDMRCYKAMKACCSHNLLYALKSAGNGIWYTRLSLQFLAAWNKAKTLSWERFNEMQRALKEKIYWISKEMYFLLPPEDRQFCYYLYSCYEVGLPIDW